MTHVSRCFGNARLQDAYAAAQKSLEQRLDQYRFSYEARAGKKCSVSFTFQDLRSHLCLREDEKSKEQTLNVYIYIILELYIANKFIIL